MSAHQEPLWRQKEEQQKDDAGYKSQLRRKRKRKMHATHFESFKQERQYNKTAKNNGSGVVLLRED